jgi:hypothetical protein
MDGDYLVDDLGGFMALMVRCVCVCVCVCACACASA